MKLLPPAHLAVLGLLLATASPLPAAERPAPPPKAGPAKTKAAKPKPKTAKRSEPVHIWAHSIHYESAKGIVHILGGETTRATIIKRDLWIEADVVDAYLDTDEGEKKEKPEPAASDKAEGEDTGGQLKFRRIVATGNVRIHSIVPLLRSGRPAKPPKLIRDAAKIRALMQNPDEDLKRGNCVLAAPDKRRAVADKADYDLKTENCVLTGAGEKQPVAWVDENEVHADVIIYEQKTSQVKFRGNVRLAALVAKQEPQPATAPPKKPKEKP